MHAHMHFRKERAFITALMHFRETIHGTRTHNWTKNQLLFSVLPWYVGLSCQLRFVDWIHISFCELMYLTHEHLRGTVPGTYAITHPSRNHVRERPVLSQLRFPQ
jgi:hypothetical protein